MSVTLQHLWNNILLELAWKHELYRACSFSFSDYYSPGPNPDKICIILWSNNAYSLLIVEGWPCIPLKFFQYAYINVISGFSEYRFLELNDPFLLLFSSFKQEVLVWQIFLENRQHMSLKAISLLFLLTLLLHILSYFLLSFY